MPLLNPLTGHPLRRRLAAALAGLAAASAMLVGLIFWATETLVEETTLERRLSLELDGLIAAGVNPLELGTEPDQLGFYRPRQSGKLLPPELQALAPGEHHDVPFAGLRHTVLVRDLASGDRAVLVFHDTAAQTRELWLGLATLLTVVIAVLVGFWLANRLARQALMPLDSLVSALGALNPEERHQRLPPASANTELAVITQQFNSYMAQLDQVVAREKAFSAAASHELRTPIAVIQGAAEVLLAQGRDSAPLQRIYRAALAARRDLDAMLWLSRTGAAPAAEHLALHLRLKDICAEQIDVTKVQWQLHECELTAPSGAVGVIVSNLLRNALKAAPQPGAVRLRLSAICLEVEDDGPGIEPELLPNIFEPGTKGHDGGTGMGLYIASALSQRLGWVLTLENRAEGGTKARLRFAAAA